MTIGDGVFIGPGSVFINDRKPRAINIDGSLKKEEDWNLEKTEIKNGASIGAGSVIMCGVTIGEYAVVGAGAVVTNDVPSHSLVIGNPAKIIKRDLKW